MSDDKTTEAVREKAIVLLADALRNLIAVATDAGYFVSLPMIEARDKASIALDVYLSVPPAPPKATGSERDMEAVG